MKPGSYRGLRTISSSPVCTKKQSEQSVFNNQGNSESRTATEHNVKGKYCLADPEGWGEYCLVNDFKVFNLVCFL